MSVKEACLAGRVNHRKEMRSGFERTKKSTHVFQRERLRARALSLLINRLLDALRGGGTERSALLALEAPWLKLA